MAILSLKCLLALAAGLSSVAAVPLRTRDGEKPSLPYDPNTTSYCSWWLDNTSSSSCQTILDNNWIDLASFFRWNPSVKSDCSGLATGRSYCIEAFDEPEPGVTTTAAVVTTTKPPTMTVPPTTTTAPAGNGVETPSPVHPGLVKNCSKFEMVQSGDTCDAISRRNGVTSANIIAWNGLNAACTNVWASTYACVGVIGGTTPPTTTTPGNGVATPTPIQPGMVSNCNKFHDIKVGTTCQAIADYNKFPITDFYKWNPGVNAGCTNLLLGAYACTGVIGGSSDPPTTTKPGNGIATPTPVQPGMVSNCNKFHDTKVGTTCQAIADYNKIALSDFYKWNPGVNSGCTNLQLGAYTCTGVIGGSSTPPTTTKPGNGIATPTPVQPGMVSNCNKFHDIKSTTTCQGIADYNKIALSDFYKWNPGVNSGCTNLQLGAYACTGVVGGNTTPPAVQTPTPTQEGMVKGCTAFATVRPTTTCQGILDWNKITLSNFVKWNPAVRSDCSNLWAGTWACIAGP